MDSLKLENLLNEKTGCQYNFQFKGVSLDKNTGLCFVEIFYNDGTILSSEIRNEVEDILKQNLPAGFNYEIKFIKNYVSNSAVKDMLTKYIKKEFPAIEITVEKCLIEDENKEVVLGVSEREFDFFVNRNIKSKIEKFLEDNFQLKINIETIKNKVIDNYIEDEIDLDDFDSLEEKTIVVHSVVPVVGTLTDTEASYIRDKKTIGDEIVICGNLAYFTEKSYIPKKKEKPEQKEQEKTENEQELSQDMLDITPNEKFFFKFGVQDFTGQMNCVIFANKNTLENLRLLSAGDSVIVFGKIEEDKFSGGISLRVRDISKCVLPEKFEEEIVYKSEPKNYKYVFPSAMEYTEQTDLFGEKKEITNQFVLNNKFVVFDFETTGLSVADGAKIIEIGAVKIENGKITDKFMCFVDPECHIPADSTAIHGIVDDDVKGAPTYQKALPDFYKFTKNCYLVGYNSIKFDYGFLSTYGKKCGYNFDNEQIDVYNLALKGVSGVKNYKLGTIAEKLGVCLDNAHRAVYDALATAEVFLKLTDYIEVK